MSELAWVILLTSGAGAAIPVGGLLAVVEHFCPGELRRDLLHGVIAFGGGVLMAAVALVLVPHGVRHLRPDAIVASFAAGGVVFMCADQFVQSRGGQAAQLLAMVIDFAPEALAMGAAYATGSSAGPVLALLIAMQNLPEGFNALRELKKSGMGKCAALGLLTALVVLGPAAGASGYLLLGGHPRVVGVIMLFAAGGILYLTFQDIAPESAVRGRGLPSLFAVAGFLVGLLGQVLLGA